MPSAIWTGTISFGLVTVPGASSSRPRKSRGRALQPARGGHRRAHPVPEGVGADRRRGPDRQDRQGLRDRERPVRRRRRRRARARSRRRRAARSTSRTSSTSTEIDPIYFEQPYYLMPDKNAAKPYRLLVEAMTDARQGRDRPHRDAVEGAARRDPAARRDAVPRDDALRRRGGCRRRRDRAASRRTASRPSASSTMARQLVERSLEASSSRRSTTTSTASSCSSLIDKKAAGEEIVARPRGRGAGQGARPHGRARGEPGPHEVARAARPRPRRPGPPRAGEEGRGQEGAGEEGRARQGREQEGGTGEDHPGEEVGRVAARNQARRDVVGVAMVRRIRGGARRARCRKVKVVKFGK